MRLTFYYCVSYHFSFFIFNYDFVPYSHDQVANIVFITHRQFVMIPELIGIQYGIIMFLLFVKRVCGFVSREIGARTHFEYIRTLNLFRLLWNNTRCFELNIANRVQANLHYFNALNPKKTNVPMPSVLFF